MATIQVGSVRNFQDGMRTSVPMKRISWNFHSGDLRSGHFHDLPIISLWGNMKMLPVLHKPTETTQFFQEHSQSPHLWWSRCNWWSWVTGRSSEVTWGHNPFFANNSWQDEDRDAQMVPNDLAYQSGLEAMHIDLLGSWTDLTWPEVRFWNWSFKVKRYVFWSVSTSWTRLCHFRFCISII